MLWDGKVKGAFRLGLGKWRQRAVGRVFYAGEWVVVFQPLALG